MGASDDPLYKLEYLSLVSKIAAEIENHLGISDRILAEFVISLHDDAGSLKAFQQKLDDAGAEFSHSFVENIDRLIRTLHPKHKQGSAGGSRADVRTKLTGLAIPDQEWRPSDADDDSVAREAQLRRTLHARREASPPPRRPRAAAAAAAAARDWSPPPDPAPCPGKVYSGQVASLKDFGAFVTLRGVAHSPDGLVHVSAIARGARIDHPRDVLRRGQDVFVKVNSVAGNRISLSMRDVDQETGVPHRSAERGVPQAQAAQAQAPPPPPPARRGRLTSPERFEIKQLIASGVAQASDYPELLNEEHATPSTRAAGIADADEEVEIEVHEKEAPFLAGHASASLELSPVRVVKAPDGSMNRAAQAGAALARERKELRQQEAHELAEPTAKPSAAAWLDPMAPASERTFAQDTRAPRAPPPPPAAAARRPFTQPTTFGKITSLSMQEQRESLPIFRLRAQLVQAVRDNQVLIVVGDTGSGKTTQLTQYLAEEGFADRKKVGCTQPRRVAAVSVAKRVAEEVGSRVGQDVGYTIRFEDCTSPATRIKYMTDGMLQRECLVDPDVNAYSVIMLDEAHERTIATDVLFGLLKKALHRRPDLKLIVTSATLDAEKFSTYFYGAPIFTIPGRTYPVEILYTKEPESDYLDAALITVMQIHLTEPPGDMLVFLTGQEEIDTSCEVLHERMRALGPGVPELIVLPVYSALPSEMQSRIFEPAPPGARKVVLATNIAETSITIDGIYYVIDPGFVKQNAYDPRLGMDSLVVTPISQAQARQRAGRAGRTGPGKCYRLYTEQAFQNEMLPSPVPDIQRQNLSSTILMLKAMGVNDLLNFDFMDPPPPQTMITAMEQLYALSALDDDGLLTRLGRKMADFPMDPQMAKMLIASVELGCSAEVLSIVAMLSIQNVFYRPKDRQAQADAKRARFFQPEGDHLTLLTVYNAWAANGYSMPWCLENYVQGRSLRRAQDVRKQLVSIMDRYHHEIISCGPEYNLVRRAICSGYFRNAAKRDPQEGFRTLAETSGTVYLHPSSSLFGRAPEYCVYHEVVITSKEYMREVTAIEPKWLVEVAPRFFRTADPAKISRRKRQEKIKPLYDKYSKDQDSWRLSRQHQVRATYIDQQTF